jgi:hypothetical protein
MAVVKYCNIPRKLLSANAGFSCYAVIADTMFKEESFRQEYDFPDGAMLDVEPDSSSRGSD